MKQESEQLHQRLIDAWDSSLCGSTEERVDFLLALIAHELKEALPTPVEPTTNMSDAAYGAAKARYHAEKNALDMIGKVLGVN